MFSLEVIFKGLLEPYAKLLWAETLCFSPLMTSSHGGVPRPQRAEYRGKRMPQSWSSDAISCQTRGRRTLPPKLITSCPRLMCSQGHGPRTRTKTWQVSIFLFVDLMGPGKSILLLWSSLGCPHKHWKVLEPQALRKNGVTFYFTEAQTLCSSGAGEKWPLGGSLNYNASSNSVCFVNWIR